MNELAGAFDPDLKPVFSKSAYTAARVYRQDARSLFHALIQGGEEPGLYPVAYHFIAKQLSRLPSSDREEMPAVLDADGLSRALPVKPAIIFSLTCTPKQMRDCLTRAQPVILTEPCWLQNILHTAGNQSPVTIALSIIYSSLGASGVLDRPFQSLLLQAGQEIPDLGSMAFAEQRAIDDQFFAFAALQLALAHFPRAYFPEILGFTFAYCHCHSLLDGFAASGHPGLAHYLRHRRNRLTSLRPAVVDAIRDHLAQSAGCKNEIWRRIASGFDLYHHFLEECESRLRSRCESPETDFQAVARLVTEKAPAAFGHHRQIRLGERTLDDWFAEQPFDSHNFLAALRESPYVNRQKPEASRLLELFEFNGPMFGVLNENDKQVLKRWLIQAPAGVSKAPCPVAPESEMNWLPDDCGDSMLAFDRLSRRELYYHLVNADLYPEVLPAARHIARKVLRSSHWFNRPPFKHYRHNAFTAYIDALYQGEVKAYEPLAGKPKLSRQAYVWGIEQLAPAILTDGCWLQRVSRLKFTPHAAIGEFLYKIYDDETGNGVVAQNHPVIYRQLLDSLQIDLPPIHDQTFCRHPGFIDSAFDIPVYLMAISLFPVTFLPELLGLNMAIELSGLGRVYLRLAQELRFWGIDPKIVNVHITIDNPVSGHAAIAQIAIQRYLDQIGASQGEAAVDAHWRRIYDGYCSLATVSRAFQFALLAFYSYKQLKCRFTGRHVFSRRYDQNV